jgi:uncharacterized protein (DUF1778 family)
MSCHRKNKAPGRQEPADWRPQLERADAESGRDQSDRIAEATADEMADILGAHHVLELSERDMDALLDAIANPPEPNDAMLRSIARWRARMKP